MCFTRRVRKNIAIIAILQYNCRSLYLFRYMTMKYWLKSALGVFVSFLVIVITAIITVIATFNPNYYKAEISQWVRVQTGRDLNLEGEIRWSLLPLSLELEKVSLRSPAGFKTTEFVNIGSAKLLIDWLPLFEQKIEVTALQFNAIQLTLSRQTDGKTNWKNLPIASKKSETANLSQPSFIKSLHIKQISLNDSQIIWDDQLAKTHYNVNHLSFSTQVYADLEKRGLQLLDIKLASEIVKEQNKQSLSLTIPQLQLDISQQKLNWNTELQFGDAKLHSQLQITNLLSNPTYQAQLQLAEFDPTALFTLFNIRYSYLPKTVAFGIELQGSLTGDNFIKNLAAKADDYRLQLTEAKVNLGDQLMETDNLKLQLLGHEIVTQLKATELLSHPKLAVQTKALGITLTSNLALERQPNLLIRATLKLDKLDMRALAATLKLPLPETTDKKVFNSLALETQIEASPTQLDLPNLNLILDESALKGEVRVKNFQQPALSFRLNLDNIDVDRYLSPKSSDKEKNSAMPPIPMDLLKKLNVNGTLSITNFKIAKARVKEMSLKFITKDGKVKVSMLNLLPNFAAFFGGTNVSKVTKVINNDDQNPLTEKIKTWSPLLVE